MLLDTCALLWLVQGSHFLSLKILETINAAPIVYVSAISAFEITIKSAKKKLSLPLPVEEWWKNAVSHHNLDVVSVSDEIFLRSASLPAIHADPADRIIIATALLKNIPVITSDGNFKAYGVEVLF